MVYRAALIGCGKIGSDFADDPRVKGVYTHAGAYAACPETDLVAVCDSDPDRARKCAQRWGGVAAYTSVDQLLEQQRPDFVSVCTPDATHEAVLRSVLGAPATRAVLAEKPLALRVDQAQHLTDLARDRGVVLAVNYSRRYSGTYAEVAALIRSGKIGSIQKVVGLYTKGVMHNGSHWFDLARWMIGEVRAVRGFSGEHASGEDPTLDAWLAFDNGATGFLHGCSADAYAVFEMDIVGTQGRVRFVDSGHRIETFRVAPSPRYSGYDALHESAERDGELEHTLLGAVEDVVGCLTHGREPRCTGRDGVAALRIASAVMRSAQSGSEVRLEETAP